MKPEDFADRQPAFAPEEYFAGDTRAWGIFEDRFGRLRREFVVDIKGQWEPQTQTLTLDETFRYSDGERDRRVWTLRRTDENRWEGTAADVVGTASGKVYGNALNLTYTLALKAGGRTWDLRFDDWMWRLDEDVVINRARVSKFGIEVGEVTLFFRKPPATATGRSAAAVGQSAVPRAAAE